jgi:hypothetical protein
MALICYLRTVVDVTQVVDKKGMLDQKFPMMPGVGWVNEKWATSTGSNG